MKKPVSKILPYIIIAAFLFYWVSVFILSIPANYAKIFITHKAPQFTNLFGTSWKLFTPPNTYNDRLYYIIKEIDSQGKPDTIEVLENISLQKQRHIPFNQKENIIDHLVNYYVVGLKSIVRQNIKIKSGQTFGITDSINQATIKAGPVIENYAIYIAALTNYCKVVLKENHFDTSNKEIKIVIKEKPIQPFKDTGDTVFSQQETLVFESPYNRLTP